MTAGTTCAVPGLPEVVRNATLAPDAHEKVADWCVVRCITTLQDVATSIDNLCSELNFKVLEKKRFKKSLAAAVQKATGAASAGAPGGALVIPAVDVAKVLNLKVVRPSRNCVRKQRFVCRLSPVIESREEYQDIEEGCPKQRRVDRDAPQTAQRVAMDIHRRPDAATEEALSAVCHVDPRCAKPVRGIRF